ncbi:integrase core domain-containing protein [Roseibium album]|uniref:integrase core domain-containing protein n=1 Tax=Roseibium album TaxID=311410 RepID=UPI003CD0E071
MDKVIIIDASQILTIMRRSGVDGLSALLGRGDYFFFSDDLKHELEIAEEWESKNGKVFQRWREVQRVNGRLLEVDTRVSIEEYEAYDFGKRGTSRGGKELSDMSIRKFMLQNKHRFTFELISRDLELLDHRVDDPKHPLYGLQFDRLSTRSALTWLATHPDVPLNPQRLRSLVNAIQDGKFDLSKERGITTHELEREKFHLPETYADALRERMRRAATEPRRRSDIKGLKSQADARLGIAPVDQGSAVPLSPSGAPFEGQLDGLTEGQSGGEIGGPIGERIDPEAGLSGKASGSLQKEPKIGHRFMTMLRRGAPIVMLSLAIPPIFSAVRARAEERNIPFDQAARELGLELGEEELKDLAAEAGVDLAVTFTPIGPLKKAWDVLGNIDDVVSLMQLYGAAYPDNEVIQQMAALADDVADSTALAAYVEGRDALTGAVGGVLEQWAYLNKVELDFSSVGVPTDNAYIEAFNSCLIQECLNASWLLSMDDTRTRINDWKTEYNEISPNSSLGNLMSSEFAAH